MFIWSESCGGFIGGSIGPYNFCESASLVFVMLLNKLGQNPLNLSVSDFYLPVRLLVVWCRLSLFDFVDVH